MPYCTQCGNQVGTVDRFCARCGKLQGNAQAGAPPPPPPPPYPGGQRYSTPGFMAEPIARMSAVDSRTASLLCYVPIVGWIMSIVVLASAKYRDDLDTRFHAFQGLYLFVAWLITHWVLSSTILLGLHIGPPLKALLIAASVFMLIKVSHRERFKLPIIGDLAEKSVSEQQA